jgi:hypothetical protein
MTDDSLKIHKNEDGSFSLEWSRTDPRWSVLNNMTSKEIQNFIEQEMLDDDN